MIEAEAIQHLPDFALCIAAVSGRKNIFRFSLLLRGLKHPRVQPVGNQARDDSNVTVRVGRSHKEVTARFQHPRAFREEQLWLWQMLQHPVADANVYRACRHRPAVARDLAKFVEEWIGAP